MSTTSLSEASLRVVLVAAVFVALGAAREVQANEAQAHGRAAFTGKATAAALRLSDAPSPLAARYAVSAGGRAAGGAVSKVPRHDWYFYRDAQRIALLKGPIDELWHRDDRGRISFERVFHDDERVADYSAGELATLNVRVDWSALSTFIDPTELLSLKVVERRGQGSGERVRLSGTVAGEHLSVDWLPALQIPERMTRTGGDQKIVRIELREHGAIAPMAWPQPGARSADYVRLDAADFGDMQYEPVVRKSEALDIRLGWRSAHKHD